MAILVAVISLMATLGGGVVALRVHDRKHLVLGLAAGLMLGVVGFDLMPESLEQAGWPIFGVPAAMVAAVAGFLSIHIVERSLAVHRGSEEHFGSHHHGSESIGLTAAGALVVHSFLDGVGIGAGFQASLAVGISVAIAVIGHDFADGFNTFTIASLYGNARKRALTLLALDGIAPVAGAVVGSVIRFPEPVIGVYLGYFAGFLLYIASSNILPEAHAGHPSRATLGLTVLGAGFMWLVVGVTH